MLVGYGLDRLVRVEVADGRQFGASAMSDADPDYPALRIGNLIFGGSTLSSRVRQRDGLCHP
jgi:hypothetical protein